MYDLNGAGSGSTRPTPSCRFVGIRADARGRYPPAMPLAVRAATVLDARRIAEIHVAGWRAAYRGLMPDAVLDGLSVDEREGMWRRNIAAPASPENRNWVACDGAEIVAMAVTGPSRDDGATPDVAELFALYADPARWGTGAGRLLTSHVVADMGRRGTREVTLWVLAGNARARRFYEIAGFAADGAEKLASFGGVSLTELRYRSGVAVQPRPT
jgi:GNAT superfamily N-acetyltransferase